MAQVRWTTLKRKAANLDRRNFLDPIDLQYSDPNTTKPQLTNPHDEWKVMEAMTWISIADVGHEST